MILGIICFIFACLGIYGFYNDIYILTYIGFGLSIFECILGKIEGTLKSMQTTIVSAIIGWIVTKNFWLGISIGVCFENAIMFIGGSIMMIAGITYLSKAETNNNYNNFNKIGNENNIEKSILKRAEEIAKLRGFNNWNELERVFIKENNITEELNKMTIEEKFNYIANVAGVNDFNELYNVCISESKSTKN